MKYVLCVYDHVCVGVGHVKEIDACVCAHRWLRSCIMWGFHVHFVGVENLPSMFNMCGPIFAQLNSVSVYFSGTKPLTNPNP